VNKHFRSKSEAEEEAYRDLGVDSSDYRTEPDWSRKSHSKGPNGEPARRSVRLDPESKCPPLQDDEYGHRFDGGYDFDPPHLQHKKDDDDYRYYYEFWGND